MSGFKLFDRVPEIIFEKVILKKSADNNKSMKNDPELRMVCSKLY